ncbi:MAG: hypothetical protein IKF14_00770 [Atopobiaceae bacterium]|nr:hypothetical protein [Atopobiaceae bacterium]
MAEDVTNNQNQGEGKGSFFKSLSAGAWAGIVAAALVVGLLIGHFAMGGSSAGGSLNKTTLTESELDTVVAVYSYNGAGSNITAREVLEQNGTLDAAKDEDGNYTVPSADTILSYARNAIIAAEADSKGIEVTDDDLSAYAEEMLGSSDFSSIASTYGMDEDTVKEVLRGSAKMNKLRDEVVGKDNGGTAPEAPTAPEVAAPAEGEEQSEEAQQAAQDAANDAPKKEYADYIIKLAGDEWDAKKGKWKSDDGAYATALADYEVTKDGASYNAAQAAYYVAYQEYSTKQTEISEKWTDYVNGLLGNSAIDIHTLKS